MAVEPGSALREWLRRLIAVLREAHPDLSWTPPENIHLTLKFLGEVHRDRVGEVLAVIQSSACTREPPLVLPFGDFGQFGGTRAPRILWLGLEPGEDLERLTRLQDGLEREFERIGFAPEERPWKPHLTLARNPRHRKVGAWRRLAGSVEKPPALEVREWTLFRSDPGEGGPRYRVLGRAPLGSAGAEEPSRTPGE